MSFLCWFIVLTISEVADTFLDPGCILLLCLEILFPMLNDINALTTQRIALLIALCAARHKTATL